MKYFVGHPLQYRCIHISSAFQFPTAYNFLNKLFSLRPILRPGSIQMVIKLHSGDKILYRMSSESKLPHSSYAHYIDFCSTHFVKSIIRRPSWLMHCSHITSTNLGGPCEINRQLQIVNDLIGSSYKFFSRANH